MTKRHVLLKVVHLVVESAGLPLSRPVVIRGSSRSNWRDHATCLSKDALCITQQARSLLHAPVAGPAAASRNVVSLT